MGKLDALALLLTLGVIIIFANSQVSGVYVAEIDPKLINLAPGTKSNIMVTISKRTHAVLAHIAAQQFASREERLNALHDALLAHATLTQAPVITALRPFAGSINFISYWISNQIFVKGATSPLIQLLSLLPSVLKIEPEFLVPLVELPVNATSVGCPVPATPQSPVAWNILKIRAPDAWGLRFEGEGIILANIDTGVKMDHPALADRFLGVPFGWYDPYICDPNNTIGSREQNKNDRTARHMQSTTPTDTEGHGTHTMGIAVGGNGIGVARKAKWSACRGCTIAGCLNVALVACGQWAVCPYDPDPLSPTYGEKDCSKAPHVVSNSWGGGSNNAFYNDVVAAWNVGGITGVFAAGNSGPKCSTLSSPGDQTIPGLIGVGATDKNDVLASYSSVGPPAYGSPPPIKPDIVAPGSDVISSYFSSISGVGVEYCSMSGTSMATPHVAGVVALMKSKNVKIKFDDVRKALIETADRDTLVGAGQICGGQSDSDWPNYSFGHGRVNALEAVKATPAP